MDIWLHILLICIIGVFFFLDRYSKSFNPMMFVIIFSMLGMFFLMTTDIQIVDYLTATYSNGTVSYNTTNANDLGIGLVNLQSFFVIIYVWFLFISAVNLVLGKKDSEDR